MKKNFLIKKKQPYIIAEIGLNHDGNFNKTFSLIKSAKRAGADAVKFQLFKAKDLYLENSKNFKLLKKLELSFSQIHKLRKFSKKLNVDFICTPFSIEAAAFLKKIKVDAIKIASMDANNLLLIKYCIRSKIPLIISTGMCNKNDLIHIKKITKKLNNISILHCISNYPSLLKDLDLGLIYKLKKLFGHKYKIGYSDHSVGITACLIALVNGAEIIEKHFTLKKNFKGDHLHSSDEQELKHLSSFAKNKNLLFSRNTAFNQRKDLFNKRYFRRGLYAAKDLKKGDVLNYLNLNIVRPQNNHNLRLDENLFKKQMIKNVEKNKKITSKNTHSNKL